MGAPRRGRTIRFGSRSPGRTQTRFCPLQPVTPRVYRTWSEFSERWPTATRGLRCKRFGARRETGLRQRLSQAIARQKCVEILGYTRHAASITFASEIAQLRWQFAVKWRVLQSAL